MAFLERSILSGHFLENPVRCLCAVWRWSKKNPAEVLEFSVPADLCLGEFDPSRQILSFNYFFGYFLNHRPLWFKHLLLSTF